MRFMLRTLCWLAVVAVIGTPIALLAYGIEDTARVPKQELALSELSRARALNEAYNLHRLPANTTTTIALTAADVNALLNAALAAVPGAHARALLGPQGLSTTATMELPLPGESRQRYLNLHAVFPPSQDGIAISRLSIGRIDFPPALAKPLSAIAIDALVGEDKSKVFLGAVRSVAVSEDRITFAYHPPERMVEKLKTAVVRAARAGNPQKVRVYWEELEDIRRSLPPGRTVSLSAFMAPLFHLAHERSETHDPVEENRAALFALAMYFGEPRFERFVGEVLTPAERARGLTVDHVRLEGRLDWVQHFTISAGLALAGGRRLSEVIGEAKELDDIKTASGYSFTDLAADRAGTRLAERALASEEGARRVQSLLSARRDEAAFFPKIGDLPEGLSPNEFQLRFGSTTSEAYLRMVTEIERRIAQIPAYR
jgi:hypothetical protein